MIPFDGAIAVLFAAVVMLAVGAGITYLMYRGLDWLLNR